MVTQIVSRNSISCLVITAVRLTNIILEVWGREDAIYHACFNRVRHLCKIVLT
jgi:hypothetical protein